MDKLRKSEGDFCEGNRENNNLERREKKRKWEKKRSKQCAIERAREKDNKVTRRGKERVF